MQNIDSNRKNEHIQLTEKSQIKSNQLDARFNYEPLFGSHLNYQAEHSNQRFLGKNFKYPFWFSSMTGGAKNAKNINKNMAIIAKKYGLGMGLGSCRKLLDSDEHLADFQIREFIGDDRPLYANLGIAQVEYLIENSKSLKIVELIKKIEADGLIVHINPLQEWFQPEGDRLKNPIFETIKKLRDQLDIKIIIKEVGQGFGPETLKFLDQLGLSAIEFGAFGGTNFSYLEALRSQNHLKNELGHGLISVGHSASDMVSSINLMKQSESGWKTEIIISGGMSNPLDAFYLLNKSNVSSIVGLAGSVLKYADESTESLDKYISQYLDTYFLAKSFLKIRS